MSSQDFARAIDWIGDTVFPRIGISRRHHLTIEYLGGEVLLIPPHELAANVAHARQSLSTKVGHIRDGAQSNLIGSPERVTALADLFEGRIGTSWDKHSGQRHIHGNPELYNAILNRSLRTLHTNRRLKPGRVIVVDAQTAPHITTEVQCAAAEGYDLVLRPAFQGGSTGVDFATLDTLKSAFQEAYTAWLNTGRTQRVEPFSTLYERQQAHHNQQYHIGGQGCPFQADCAFRSLSLDPDGALYICQEMADSGHFPLGNALQQRFEEDTWKRLAQRQQHLDQSCQKCPWKQSCGGGCMNEAIHRFGDPFAKTELCSVWTALFRAIDATILEDTHAAPLAPQEF